MVAAIISASASASASAFISAASAVAASAVVAAASAGAVTSVALVRARGRLGSRGISLFCAVFAIDKFAVSFRCVTTKYGMGGGLEPTTQAGVRGGSALATVFERAAVHWTFDVVNQIEETPEVTCGEVVTDALENVEDLVIRDPAVVVLIGIFMEFSEDLVKGHHLL